LILVSILSCITLGTDVPNGFLKETLRTDLSLPSPFIVKGGEKWQELSLRKVAGVDAEEKGCARPLLLH
jgi:hypothetical protein